MWDDEIIKSWCVFDNIRLLHTTSKRESRLKVRSVTTTLKPTTMTILRRQHPRTPPIRYGCDNGRSCETWTIPWSIREPRTWLTWAPWLPGSGGCDGRNLAEPATGVGWFIHWPVLKHGLESKCKSMYALYNQYTLKGVITINQIDNLALVQGLKEIFTKTIFVL